MLGLILKRSIVKLSLSEHESIRIMRYTLKWMTKKFNKGEQLQNSMQTIKRQVTILLGFGILTG